MRIEILKTVHSYEVVRVTDRGQARKKLLDPATAYDLPDYIGIRRRGAEDREDYIQGPFSTLQDAMDAARSQDHHYRTYSD